MKHRNIAETRQELLGSCDPIQVQVFEDPSAAEPSSIAKDGIHFGVVERGLQIRGPDGVGPGQIPFMQQGVRGEHDLVALFLKEGTGEGELILA
jgi:hypothetical protein